MLFSIFYYNETITTAKTIGIFLALCALVCTVLKKQGKGFDKRHLHFPLILFFGMGLLDVSIKFVQYEYISDGNSAGFASAIFFKERLSVLNWVGVSLSIAAISIFIRA